MSIITLGIDLAKNIFALHGVDHADKPALVKSKVPRDQLLTVHHLTTTSAIQEKPSAKKQHCWQ